MLIRICTLFNKTPSLREYSTYSTPYHRKIHALPFILDPKEAETLLRAAANVSVMSISTFVKGFFGLLPNFVLERMSPVYVPTWSVDAEVEFKCVKNGKVLQPTFFVAGAQMPGHSHSQLATLTISAPLGADNPPTRFERSLLRTHWAQDVIALPYTVSPLALPALFRSIPLQECDLDKMTRLEASSVRFGMLSATPILYPIYLAEFTHKGGGSNGGDKIITAAVTAGRDTNRQVIGGDMPPIFIRSEVHASGWSSLLKQYDQPLLRRTACVMSEPVPDISLGRHSAKDAVLNVLLRDGLKRWAYKGDWASVGRVKDWEDTRIAAWDPEGMQKRAEYLDTGEQILGLKALLAMKKTIPEGGSKIVRVKDLAGTTEDPFQVVIKKVFGGRRQLRSDGVETVPPEYVEGRILGLQMGRDKLRDELKLGGEQSWNARPVQRRSR